MAYQRMQAAPKKLPAATQQAFIITAPSCNSCKGFCQQTQYQDHTERGNSSHVHGQQQFRYI